MIETLDLRRSFNGRVAVDGISFSVERGEVFGFLGPNGSGKTTLFLDPPSPCPR
jgi:ABC-type multidrug transport system ATPase subunit